jgi:hypothetical protein
MSNIRGRKRNAQTDLQAENSRVDVEVSREDAAHKPKRPPRVSMGATLKLEFGDVVKDPDFHFRVISDRDGRIEQAKQAWYEFALDAQGEKIVRHSGPYAQYLMKIEKKYWDEDQDLKLQKTKAKLSSEQNLQRDEYIPDGRHHVLQKDGYDALA